jgi:predicted acetyltransferase
VDLEPRTITAEEYGPFSTCFQAAFGIQPTEADLELWRKAVDLDRTLALFDREEVVGTADSYRFELTLPGGATLPVAGVTRVAVRTTHRRRGLLTALMRAQLDQAHGRGESVAILTASEGAIYGRFGYGLATLQASVELSTAHSAFGRPVQHRGRFTLVDGETARKVAPAVHDRARRRQPGDIERQDWYWDVHFADPHWAREGASGLFHLLHEGPGGEADGYAAYRWKDNWRRGNPSNEVAVVDAVADTPAGEAELWRYLLDIDLAAKVSAWHRPADDPLRWLLADARRLETTSVRDDIWVRLLDLPVALGARSYGAEGRVVLDVADAFCPWNHGPWVLEAGPDGAGRARRGAPGEQADVRLGVGELGAMFLGGVRPSSLARAGRVEELTTGALARADALFGPVGAEPQPFARTGF